MSLAPFRLARAGSIVFSNISTDVKLRVLLFAAHADALGRSAIDLELPENSSVSDVVGAVRRLPGGERVPSSTLVAVDRRYAPPAQTLRAGSEVALIPPVAGG